MTRRPRRNRRPAFMAKVAMAGIKGEKTLIEPTIPLFRGVIPPESKGLHKWNFLAKVSEEILLEDKQIH